MIRAGSIRLLYGVLLYLVVPFALLRLWWRGRRSPGYRQRIGERFGRGASDLPRGMIWIHAVSLGEVRAALPLVRALLRTRPAQPLLVTTTTPTGSQQVREALGDSVHHRYIPYDLPGVIGAFLDRLQPCLLVVMETELWPELFNGCRRRGIPLLLANARLSPRSARGYARVPWLTRPTLAAVDVIGAQSAADAERFRALGAPYVECVGNLKFDLSVPAGLAAQGQALRDTWGAQRRVWIAASTHAGEDELLLDAHAELLQRHADWLLILVPRHPERFAAVAELVRRRGLALAQRSRGEAAAGSQVYLGDTLGELLLLYAAADVAFVGGSLVAVGGHNVLEPAALGVPVLFGRHMFNFAEAEQLLLTAGGGQCVDAGAALVTQLEDWLTDAQARARASAAAAQVVAQNRGALARLLGIIETLLPEKARRGG